MTVENATGSCLNHDKCVISVSDVQKRWRTSLLPLCEAPICEHKEPDESDLKCRVTPAPDDSNVQPLRTSREAIAICGIGVRLPGGIRSTEDFWELLIQGQDARGPMTASRLASPGVHDQTSPPTGYFLDENLCDFDPSIFRLSRTELEQADPQQRKLLQVTRECLDNAGEADFRGKNVGCYVGTFGDDWMQLLSKDDQLVGGIDFRGTIDAMLANRLSYEFDFRGPR
jgi:acyl transferase domain-containing protein